MIEIFRVQNGYVVARRANGDANGFDPNWTRVVVSDPTIDQISLKARIGEAVLKLMEEVK